MNKKIYFILSFFIVAFSEANTLTLTHEMKSVQSKSKYSISELKKLHNDKEVIISSFAKDEVIRIKEKYSDKQFNNKVNEVFLNHLQAFLDREDANCELNYIAGLIKTFSQQEISNNQDELEDILKLLRVQNTIDDIYYEILKDLTSDHYALIQLDLTSKSFSIKNHSKDYNIEDLNRYFANFKTYPDEITSCSYKEIIILKENVSLEKDSKKEKFKKVKNASHAALQLKVIGRETFNKIKFLVDKSTLRKRSVWLNDYFKIIFSAKNKMIPHTRNYKVINLEDESTYSSEKLKRFSNLTRRKVLFNKYNENQIILLSQAMKKASQRMGVDPDTKTSVPYLIHEFTVINQSGGTDNLVERIDLDAQSQFNLARRLLRKDIVGLQMMKSFQGLQISYEDLVLASLETGYISLDDIDYVVKYDDLWNPIISKSERMINLSFKLAGYGTFFIPPPWNITAGLALVIIEGIVDSTKTDGASNDNPNTFIE